jgi:hypothetical protein
VGPGAPDEPVAAFSQKQPPAPENWPSVQWTADEQVAAHIVTNEVHFYAGNDVGGERTTKLRLEGLKGFSLSPGCASASRALLSSAPVRTSPPRTISHSALVLTQRGSELFSIDLSAGAQRAARPDSALSLPESRGRPAGRDQGILQR